MNLSKIIYLFVFSHFFLISSSLLYSQEIQQENANTDSLTEVNGMIVCINEEIAKLFEVTVPTINEHLNNVFQSKELDQDSVIRKFRITASDGKSYKVNHYNLEGIIAIGFKVNSDRAVEFRRWAN